MGAITDAVVPSENSLGNINNTSPTFLIAFVRQIECEYILQNFIVFVIFSKIYLNHISNVIYLNI